MLSGHAMGWGLYSVSERGPGAACNMLTAFATSAWWHTTAALAGCGRQRLAIASCWGCCVQRWCAIPPYRTNPAKLLAITTPAGPSLFAASAQRS